MLHFRKNEVKEKSLTSI